jgi:hypothetical protein
LIAISRRAAEIEMGPKVLSATREFFDRLQTDPRKFGSPLYRLRKMRMEVFNVVVRPLYFEYGVHDDRPVVVVRYVAWLNNPNAD